MVLHPTRPSHTRRKHTKSDMLPCAPPSIELRDLNPSGGKLGERPDPGGANSHFHKTNEVVEAVKSNGSEYVRNNGGLMVANLVCTQVHVRKASSTQIWRRTAGRKITKQVTCVLKNNLYEVWRMKAVDVIIMTSKQANATKPQATGG